MSLSSNDDRAFDTSESFALGLDESDDLSFADRFYKTPGTIYMDGNSLGLMSRDAEQSLLNAVEDYKKYAIDGWSSGDNPWFFYAERLGARMAPIVGALEDEVIVTGSTTVNLHNMLATFYRPTGTRTKLVMDEMNFPSDIYAGKSHVSLHGLSPDNFVLIPSRDGNTLDEDDIIAALTEDVCVAVLPGVLYRSGQLLDIEKLTKAAHERGVIIGFDCCHSAGSVPHRLHDWDVDFAIWCTYKYLNGGPGASAGAFINRRHHNVPPGLPGWFSNNKDTQFDMSLEFESSRTAGAWQIGSPNLFNMAPIAGSLGMFEQAGMENLRTKSLHMTSYLMFLIDSAFAPDEGFSIVTPRQAELRGGHVALAHDTESIRINACLKQHGIVPDFRFPNIIRLAPIPLYTTYHELWQVVETLKGIMESKEYLALENKRGTVA